MAFSCNTLKTGDEYRFFGNLIQNKNLLFPWFHISYRYFCIAVTVFIVALFSSNTLVAYACKSDRPKANKLHTLQHFKCIPHTRITWFQFLNLINLRSDQSENLLLQQKFNQKQSENKNRITFDISVFIIHARASAAAVQSDRITEDKH